MEKKKLLIMRFSSFGDIIQSMSAIDLLKMMYPISEIHFATKKEFVSLVKLHPQVDQVLGYDKKEGLIAFIKKLREHDYELVYDAHKSLRSQFITKIFYHSIFHYICTKSIDPVVVTRGKDRLKRFLLFYCHKNFFPWPFKGRVSFQAPLLKLIKSRPVIKKVAFNFGEMRDKNGYLKICQEVDKKTLTIAPSATRDMKKWPLSHWLSFVEKLSDYRFIILGGPEDTYLQIFEEKFGNRVINLAGKLNLIESCYVVSKSNVLIAADTGLMHVGDYLGIPTIALIGPTAFGFPAGDNSITLEVNLKCRPCTKDGRGKCSQAVYQKCLVDITPDRVMDVLNNLLAHIPE
ncbi:MAG: hypothetical protein A2381_13640 [Bdellovibrionales bacterium RIFOXYB1_FULL_37_110]|nr:MAG: hypothetical protein A2417_05275 [Bdellovibrionales bacterium RIFOXYC1_FULL_37_79]OFZ56904.1 MAG: hypothetical protein A2381_13640 [Bdellovibrionales bacterium RIFOXYB1_FULL_37_110]OFZ61991.1 MAG: hypothetical protein A2577_19110 [Bdellovibrionales bacterium RIFOXYD1_FULL_36_51]OFZ65769.1 MAG: hypothetical protein A2328_10515 [Bdellovibrionales bacterium RIFOXYB2_FULL_36_6]